MRKITIEATRAFYNWEKYNKSNTEVIFENNISKMYLHWNLIAIFDFKLWKLWISNAWRETVTTKERLNWILNSKWYYIKQIKSSIKEP